MRKLFTLLILIITCFGYAQKPLDMYMVGSIYRADGYSSVSAWKNGVLTKKNTKIKEHNYATSVFVSGKDVYHAGHELKFKFYVATYWKNNVAVSLTDGTQDARANAITVVGSDVYVAGVENGVALYWKNGNAVVLSDKQYRAKANAIVVVGQDVYVAGTCGTKKGNFATYWKNGTAVYLSKKNNSAYANSIAVVGSDVHVVGLDSNNNRTDIAKYWKNGVATNLEVGGWVTASAISINGQDVYIVGRGNGGAKIWKNGVETKLTNGKFLSDAHSLFIKGSDIYVGGNESYGNGSVIKYWKNGIGTDITKEKDEATTTAMFIGN